MSHTLLEISIFEDNYLQSLVHSVEVRSRQGIVTSNDLSARNLIEKRQLDMRTIIPVLSGVTIERCVGNMAVWLLFSAMVPEIVIDIDHCLSIDETDVSKIKYSTEQRLKILMSYHDKLHDANSRIRYNID